MYVWLRHDFVVCLVAHTVGSPVQYQGKPKNARYTLLDVSGHTGFASPACLSLAGGTGDRELVSGSTQHTMLLTACCLLNTTVPNQTMRKSIVQEILAACLQALSLSFTRPVHQVEAFLMKDTMIQAEPRAIGCM